MRRCQQASACIESRPQSAAAVAAVREDFRLDLLQALLLAIVQGVTEFLPISSSAHLIVPAQILGWKDQGLAFDVSVHLGSLLAVLAVLRRDIGGMVRGTLLALRTRESNPAFRTAALVFVGSIPIVMVGLGLKDLVETSLRSALVIAVATIVFGILLGFADMRVKGQSGRELESLCLSDALWIGAAQCLALVPGTSRSGITMTAGLLLGLSRNACARFSFLLSIPSIAGAAALSSADLLDSPLPVDWSALAFGFAAAAVSAWACMHFFLAMVDRIGFIPFVIYRLVLGAALLLFVFL